MRGYFFATTLAGMWAFWRAWGPAVRKSTEFLELCVKQGPVRVIAMGGFVCAPVVEAAKKFAFQIKSVTLNDVSGTKFPVITFAVVDPTNNNAAYDLKTPTATNPRRS